MKYRIVPTTSLEEVSPWGGSVVRDYWSVQYRGWFLLPIFPVWWERVCVSSKERAEEIVKHLQQGVEYK